MFFLIAAATPLSAQESSEAEKLAEDMHQILSEIGEAQKGGDMARAKALKNVYRQTEEKANRVTETLRVRGEHERAQSVEQQIREATTKHREVLERVREQAPEQAHRGLDRALQNSLSGPQKAHAAMPPAPARAPVRQNILPSREAGLAKSQGLPRNPAPSSANREQAKGSPKKGPSGR